jgi:chromosome segregation ATPase
MGIKFLFTPQVVSSIILLGMLVLTIRSILLYSRHQSELTPRLSHLDREFNKRQEGMADAKKAVAELTLLVTPLQEREAALRSYYEQLRSIEADEEKRALAQQQANEAEKKVRISRKKLGID